MSQGLSINLTVHHGIITECVVGRRRSPMSELNQIETTLVNKKLQDIQDWHSCITGDGEYSAAAAEWLNEMLPIVDIAEK